MTELIIIKTSESEKIKSLLDQNRTDYQIVYQQTISLTEEEIWKRDILLANQDEVRNKEIAEWKKISKVKDKQGW
ncbi:MAG: hypothetical protein I3273_04340 [Candidatus Moeniiplasma glomeromycotorum]|nr:hypothetical protein [Candidatus Moeniiplasma glomeromycotorum]MCE8169325.1 hypothetical protein [Candidatus Moeniiplasma glomeromycotorum]